MPMTGPIELLDAAESLGLLSNAQTSGLRAEWTSAPNLSVADAASRLVERNALTSLQASRLLDGDGQSLIVHGRYQIRELLGAGGMGEVYLARDVELARDVALKVLSPRLVCDEGAVARFRREAKAMARLAHANIVQAFDAGADADRQFLVMEYIEGASLGDMLRHGTPIDPATAADYAYQAALGLAHAHGKGIIHRDFKPGNLLITRRRQVKILDLGLARFAQDQIGDQTLTMEGGGLGTPDYMAPEQFGQAHHADERSDVYSLGCTLYHTLTGRVPFPGSSFAEKWQAHLRAQPEPIEALSPNVPTGLAQTVAKMMAKRPQDRFTNASQCAEALLPYVAASSASLPDLRTTTSWDGSQLVLMTAQNRRRRGRKWAGIGAAFILLGAALSLGLPRIWNRAPAHADAPPDPPSLPLAGRADDGDEPPQAAAQPNADPWVLTVSQDPKDGGRYRTINAALKDVKPGMTVRVLDGATYKERLVLNDPARFARITLDAVAGARLEHDESGVGTISVWDVPDVIIRGLRLHATGTRGAHIYMRGECPGVVVEKLKMSAQPGNGWNGIEFQFVDDGERGDRPIEIRHCELDTLQVGIVTNNSRGITLVANAFRRMELAAFQMLGTSTDFDIVGNIFDHCGQKAIHLIHLGADKNRLVIANNTFLNGVEALRLEDKHVPPGAIRVENNLVLNPRGPDMVFYHTTSPELQGTEPGDAAALTKAWTFANNWRETTPVQGEWIPPSETDVILDKIEGIDRDPASPNYLRPAADAPLATGGAGQTDPSLPRYVGALPPAGADPWDWDRTWLAPPGTSALLTVSKDEATGGRYRSITDALADAKPWATIRVLDDAEYTDLVTLDNPARHEGIVLESANRAALGRIEIDGVPHVVVRGFRVLAPPHWPGAAFMVKGAAEGVRLDRLEFSNLSDTTGIGVMSTIIPADGTPLIIERCRFTGDQPARGIIVQGGASVDTSARRVCVRSNTFETLAEGVEVNRIVDDVHLVGNRFRGCTMSAINVENLDPRSRRMLLANNTSIDSAAGLLIADNPPYQDPAQGSVEVAGNAFLNSLQANSVVTRIGDDGKPIVIDPTTYLDAWPFRANWQDDSGAASGAIPPIDGKLNRLPAWPFESRDPNDPTSTRPKEDSPLATGGAGGDLPTYAGATPPAGVEPWDWGITWRSRSRRTPAIDAKQAD